MSGLPENCLMPRSSLFSLSLFVLLFAVSALFGILPAYDAALSQPTLAAVLGSALLFLLTAYLTRTRFVARTVGALLVTAGTLFALYFISQFAYWNYPETPTLIQRLGRATTFLPFRYFAYLHPNGVATLLEILLPLAGALLLSSRRWWLKVMFAVEITILGYALFLTFSRGAWSSVAAAAGLAVVLALLLRLPRRTAVTLVIGAVALVIAAAAGILLLGTERLPFLQSTFAAADSRLTLYRNTLYLATDYAYSGLGLGATFGMVYSRYSLLIFVPFLTYAHNLPLAVWLGQGLLGLLALAGIIVVFYRLVYRTLRQAQPDAVFHGAWLGVTATLIHGLTDARQYVESPWTMPVLFVMLALAGALARLAFTPGDNVTDRSEPAIRPYRRGTLVLPVMAAVILVGAVLIFNAPLRALWHTNRGALAETRAELAPALNDDERAALNDAAVSAYQTALALDPTLPNASRRLGNLYVTLGRYAEAVPLLETAAAAEPDYPAAVKGLGLAYVWVGRIDAAAHTLARLDNRRDIINELNTWAVFRSEQNEPELARYARAAAERLSALP